MKRTAAIISFLMALALSAIAIFSFASDQGNASARADAEFRYLSSHDYDAMNQLMAEHRAAEQTEAIEAVGGVVFLIAGFVLWSKREAS